MRFSALFPTLCVGALLAACATNEAPMDTRAAEISAAQKSVHVPATVRKDGAPLFLAHYMPWFEAPPVSKSFGWHWHMGFYDPFVVAPDGDRPIATHYYPLIGPYDSSDARVIEYQLLTMKAAGIDGVIIDWYGIDEAFDYLSIHRASQALFEAVRKAGMTFAVCYEDQSITKLVQAKKFTQAEAVGRATQVFQWMDKNWFHDPAYLKFDGRPVVLNFGPQEFTLAAQWQTILAAASPRPWFVSLEDHMEHDADGFYNWPAMARSGGRTLRPDVLADQLNQFYQKTRNAPRLVATAWPGFHDIYEQAGVAASYGFLDDYDGQTFRMTLDAALQARPDVVQLATWNDYGEGTVLEPNKTRGYAPLEDVQAARREKDPGFVYNSDSLRLPLQLYRQRLSPGVDQALLDRIAQTFRQGNPGLAGAMLQAALPKPLPGTVVTAAAAATATASDRKNLAFGKTARSTSRTDVYTAEKATDGETLTYWEGAAKTYPHDLWVDLRSPQPVTQVVLKLNPRRIWGARTQTIEVLAGDSLETVKTVVPARDYRFDPENGGNAAVIPLKGSYQVVLLRFTNNTEAAGGQIAEFEIFSD